MVVNLWQSTCPPCARELPAFAAVDDEYGDRVRFVGIDDLDSAGDDDAASPPTAACSTSC